MWDFLTFKTFVTPDILILFYYFGAVVIPVVIWNIRGYLVRKISIFQRAQNISQTLFNTLHAKEKTMVVVLSLIIFLGMEMVWRMMFETMIGYFNMHEYLQILSFQSS